MPSTYTSPYASTFKSAVKRGASWNETVNNIAVRHNTNPQKVWESLYKADLCFRQKFNGQWIYFPWEARKTNTTNWKKSQFNSWQWFTEWCVTSGQCTPDQFNNNTGPQKDFMSWCRKFFGKQFDASNNGTSSRRRTSKSRSNASYPFASARTRKTSRRYSRAA